MRVVIPLGTGSKENWELRYHLRSLQRHCLFDFDITLLCSPEVKLDWITGVERIDIPRWYPEGLEEVYGDRLFENFFDVANKLSTYLPQAPDSFVLAYDDQLLLQPLKSFDIFNNVALCKENLDKARARSRHDKTVLEALKIAHKYKARNGLHNFATHAYRIFEKVRLQKILRNYPIEHQQMPYEISTVYFNVYYDVPNIVLKEGSYLIGYLHGMTGINHEMPESLQDLEKLTYVMISYNDLAVDKVFMGWLEKRFDTKSRFEVFT